MKQPPIFRLLALMGRSSGRNYTDQPAPRYSGEPTDTALRDRADGGVLRIVTFNIEFGLRVDAAIELFKAHPELTSADLVLLQEMSSAATARVAQALNMWYVYYPAIYHAQAKGEFGNAVLSRWPIMGDARIVLPNLSRYAGTERTATAATVLIKGVEVRVYSAHLGTIGDMSSARRREQLVKILDDAESYDKVIIGGDMNEPRVGIVAAGRGYAWPTRSGTRSTRFARLDHIFLKGLTASEVAPSGTVRPPTRISDHYPVWVSAVMPVTPKSV
ncbi:MAG: endonuclease/exonuclease/phosphatase family protein [Gemmatimonadaceae bacterium]